LCCTCLCSDFQVLVSYPTITPTFTCCTLPISHMHSSSSPLVLHTHWSSSLTWSFYLYLAKSTSYEAPHYAVFSSLLSLHLSFIQIFSSVPCSQTPSVYVPPLMSRSSFTPIQNHEQNYSFVYSNFYFFRQQTRRQKVLDWMVARITQRESPPNFLLNQILIYYFHSQIFELCYIFRGCVNYLYVKISPCILVTRQQHMLSFLFIYFSTILLN
jgi:hypothetical protein